MSSNTSMWVRIAGVSGATAVALGAIGAHAFHLSSDAMKDVWRLGSQYHFIHTLALGISAMYFSGKKRNYVCGLFSSGMLLYCGSCYTIVVMDKKTPYNSLVPAGGILMMAGWLASAIL